MANNKNTAPNTASNTAPNTAAKAEKPAATGVVLAPATVVPCPAKGRTATMAGVVGGTYGVSCPLPARAATVVLPFQLPSWAGQAGAPVTVVVASMAPNWLGRNGYPLRCTVFTSPHGAVVVQPHNRGVQVNAYPNGLPGCGIATVALGAVAAAQAAPAVQGPAAQ